MKHFIPILWLVGAAVGGLSAQEVISEADPPDDAGAAVGEQVPAATVYDEKIIPQPYAAARYQTTWNSNPFLRKTVTIAGPKVDWSQDWALAGMYRSESGKITITLQNKQTAEFKRVSSDGDENSEFRLIKANFNRNRTEASADIARGSETATLKYDDNLTSRPVTVTNTLKAPPGAPGAAGARPGQPVAPGQPGAPGQPVNPNLRPAQPGQMGQPVNVTPSAGQALVPGGQKVSTQSPASPPTISRRRSLIPAPVVPPPQPQ